MLVGREAELDRIEALLDGARSGCGGSLVLRGEPGIGKTALLAEIRRRAPRMLVATASGVESEAQLPFAALGELASPMLSGLAELPEPQSTAISTALALAPGERAINERLAMFAGFLGLIRVTARERPVLILVDDAHWLDRPSSECLGYAARRLDDVAAAMVVAARVDEAAPLAARGGGASSRRAGARRRPDAALAGRACGAGRRGALRPLAGQPACAAGAPVDAE